MVGWRHFRWCLLPTMLAVTVTIGCMCSEYWHADLYITAKRRVTTGRPEATENAGSGETETRIKV